MDVTRYARAPFLSRSSYIFSMRCISASSSSHDGGSESSSSLLGFFSSLGGGLVGGGNSPLRIISCTCSGVRSCGRSMSRAKLSRSCSRSASLGLKVRGCGGGAPVGADARAHANTAFTTLADGTGDSNVETRYPPAEV